MSIQSWLILYLMGVIGFRFVFDDFDDSMIFFLVGGRIFFFFFHFFFLPFSVGE